MDLIHQLNWRYVIKRSGARITTEKLDHILDDIRSSGSAFGLLPHTVLVVSHCRHIEHILSASNHPHIRQASHLVVFTAWTSIRHENVNELIAHIAASNGLSLDDMEDYKKAMKILVKSTNDFNLEWSTKQAYIALGIGITAAVAQKADATPVEEFDHEELDKILHLKEKGLTSVVMLALGQRDEAGTTANQTPRIKRSSDHLVPFLVLN